MEPASGATVSTQRLGSPDITRCGRKHGATVQTPWAWACPVASRGRSRSGPSQADRCPAIAVIPVSSATSRTPPTMGCSAGNSFPLGSDQSSYFGRCTSATSMLAAALPAVSGAAEPPNSSAASASRHNTPPAAGTTRHLSRSAIRGPLGGSSHQQALIVRERRALAGPLHPAAVVVQLPCDDLGGHRQVQEVLQLGPDTRVLDLHQGLHPAVEVAVHQVGTAQPHLRRCVAVEPQHPGVLQESACLLYTS